MTAASTSTTTLSGKQRRHLRALGHHLPVAVQLGKEGLTAAVVKAVDKAVLRHELVKIRVGGECPETKRAVAERLAAELGAVIAQILGRTILLYRPHPTEPVIELPADKT